MQSQKILSEVREELEVRRSTWTYLQAEWTPVFAKDQSAIREPTPHRTYLSPVMAPDIVNANPRKSCLFQAALARMHEKDVESMSSYSEPRSQAIVESQIRTEHEDKFSTELAAVGLPLSTSQTMTDFSRFLLHLAGESDLSNAQDPVREFEKSEHYRPSPWVKSDRIIR